LFTERKKRRTKDVGYIGLSTNPSVLRIKMQGRTGWINVKRLLALIRGMTKRRYIKIYEYVGEGEGD